MVRERESRQIYIHFIVQIRCRDTFTEVANWVRLKVMPAYKPGPHLTPSVRGLASRDPVRVSSRHSGIKTALHTPLSVRPEVGCRTGSRGSW